MIKLSIEQYREINNSLNHLHDIVQETLNNYQELEKENEHLKNENKELKRIFDDHIYLERRSAYLKRLIDNNEQK